MKRTFGSLVLFIMLLTQTLMPITYATEIPAEDAEDPRGGGDNGF